MVLASPLLSDGTQTELPPQDDLLPQNMTSWIPPLESPPRIKAVALSKPVVIPRVDTSSILAAKLPFVRAYSPALQPYGIDELEFLAFIDTLAVYQAAPVLLQALDKAGMIVGAVPHHWAMAASTGMSVTAGLGSAATTIIRTRRFLEKVNREFFAPRGLKASICKNDSLMIRLRCGQIEMERASAEQTSSLTDRRMQMLGPYIAPLTFSVPPPSPQRSFIDEMSAKAIERRVRKRENKENKKAEKRLHKQDTQGNDPINEGDTSDTNSDSSSSTHSASEGQHPDKKMRKIESKAERKLTKARLEDAAKIHQKKAKKIEKREHDLERRADKDAKKATEKMQKASNKDEKRSDKRRKKEEEKIASMEFLVIDNLDLE